MIFQCCLKKCFSQSTKYRKTLSTKCQTDKHNVNWRQVNPRIQGIDANLSFMCLPIHFCHFHEKSHYNRSKVKFLFKQFFLKASLDILLGKFEVKSNSSFSPNNLTVQSSFVSLSCVIICHQPKFRKNRVKNTI